jgi:hypothetical protein
MTSTSTDPSDVGRQFSAMGVAVRKERAALAKRIVRARRELAPPVGQVTDNEVLGIVAAELETRAHVS